jgi:hypothetical protein
MEKKQTAVTLLFQEFRALSEATRKAGDEQSANLIDFLCEREDVAKQMEKEQKEDFFNAGVRYGSGSVMATEWGEDTEEYNFEQYYNETFKSE